MITAKSMHQFTPIELRSSNHTFFALNIGEHKDDGFKVSIDTDMINGYSSYILGDGSLFIRVAKQQPTFFVLFFELRRGSHSKELFHSEWGPRTVLLFVQAFAQLRPAPHVRREET